MTDLKQSTAKSEFSAAALTVLAASIVAISLGPLTLLATFTLFMQPIGRDLGWDRSQISFLLTLLGLGSAMMSPLIGKAVDRWGPRRVLLSASVMFGLAVSSLSIVGRARWEIYGVFGLVGLLNAGMVPYGRMIASWFERRRGLAYGLFGFGITLAMPLLLQVARPLIDAAGWRGAYAVFGASVLFIAVPVIAFWFRDPAVSAGLSNSEQILPGASPKQAWTSRAYWLIVGSLVLSMFVYMGVLTHGVAMLTERGISRVSATTVISAISIGAMVAQPLIGYLIDRVHSPWVVAPFAGASLFGLVLFHLVSNPVGLVIAAAILGLGASGEGGTTQYWVTRYFGLRHFSLIYGSIQPINLLFAVAGGPLLLGTLYDRTGSYELAFKLMEIALAGAAVLIGLLGRYVYFNPGRDEDSADTAGLASVAAAEAIGVRRR